MKEITLAYHPEKRACIIDAAVRLFMTYGFSKVTMDDIAQAAAMSRPALYQSFRNKQDIYVAGATAMRDQSLATMAAILKRTGPPRERIMAAIGEGLFGLMEQLEKTPHGAELITMSKALPEQWGIEWRQRKIALLAPVYGEAGATEPFSGARLAEQLSDFLEGMKSRLTGLEDRIHATEAFLDVQFAAIGDNEINSLDDRAET